MYQPLTQQALSKILGFFNIYRIGELISDYKLVLIYIKKLFPFYVLLLYLSKNCTAYVIV